MRRTVPGWALLGAAAVLVITAVAALAAEDPYRPQQWGLEQIGAPEAWRTVEGAGIVIAVLDTGVDLDHPDLRDRFVRDGDGEVVGKDFVDGDDVPQDENGHGTMVAGIAVATADNGEGIAGVAPAARLLPVRVLAADGSGRYADLDEGIRWAVDAGADVVNLSLERAREPGAVGSTVGALTTPVSAVQYAWDRGVVVVAAAGNSGNDATEYPEDSPVLLVGASDREDRKAGFSNAGRSDAILAPGIEVVSTWCDPEEGGCAADRRYGVASGTSFAAPSVAGAAALLRSLGLDHRATVERLRSTARDLGPEGPDPDTGVGRLDVAAAVARPADPSPSPSDRGEEEGEDVSSAEEGPPSPAASGSSDHSGAETQVPAEPSPAPEPSASAPMSTEAPPTPTEPSPVAVAEPIPASERSAWIGLAVVLLFIAGGSVAVSLYRHGGAGFRAAPGWGKPTRDPVRRP